MRNTHLVSLFPNQLSTSDSAEAQDVAAFADTAKGTSHLTRALVRYIERTYKANACYLVDLYADESSATVSVVGDNLIDDPNADAPLGRTGWDSATVGLVFSTHPDKASAERYCRSMIDVYDEYLNAY